MHKKLKTYGIIAVILFISGCARQMGSDVYTSGAPVGKVLEGIIVSSRLVTIKDSDRLQNNPVGTIGGGLLGGVAGSGVGSGTGRGLATIGGALIGGTAGAYAQSRLGTSQGVEYVVRIDKKYISDIPENTIRERITIGDSSIDSDIKESIKVQGTKTDLISVIQGRDVVLNAGQRVLVIYSNDRPRVVPAYN